MMEIEVDVQLGTYLGIRCMQVCQDAIETFQEAISAKTIMYVSDPFLKAIESTSEKISEAIDKDTQGSGSISYETSVFLHRVGMAMHRVIDSPEGKICQYFMVSRKAITGYLEYYLEQGGDYHKNYGFLSGYYEDNKSVIYQYFRTYIMLLYFIDKCDIESVMVAPKQKVKIDGGYKFYNESGKSAIKVLDARWYRELIIKSPFAVTGHLRFQPYGEGRSKRKLIFIEPYEKKGYHRKAKAEYHGQEN